MIAAMAKFRTLGVQPTKIDKGFVARVRFPTMLRLDERTDDGRLIAGAGFESRDLPLPIMGIAKTSFGHMDAEVVGRLDFLQVSDDGRNVEGVGQLLDTPEGRRFAMLVDTQAMPGNSVDLSVQKVAERFTEHGFELDFLESKLKGTTLVPFPAFAEAYAELLDAFDYSDEDLAEATEWAATDPVGDKVPLVTFTEDSEVAGVSLRDQRELAYSFSIVKPEMERPRPVSAFEVPDLSGLTTPVIDGDRVFGYVAGWNVCHTDFMACVTPPKSLAAYAHAHRFEVPVDDGEILAVGRLYADGNHADVTGLSAFEAMEHYERECRPWAEVVFREDDFGIVMSGLVIDEPGSDLPLSGDWRRIGGNLELISALSVGRPGFPIPPPTHFTSSGRLVAITAAGMLAADCGCDTKPDEGTAIGSPFTPEMIQGLQALLEREQAKANAEEVDRILQGIG